MTKNLLLGIAAVCGSTFQAVACTGISLTSRDGSYVQARTIEWARGVLQSEYVIIPRDRQLTSFTPTGVNGLTFTAMRQDFRPDYFSFLIMGGMRRMTLHRTSGHWQTFK